MLQTAVIAFWFALLLSVAATVLYTYHFLTKRPAYSWYATFLTGAAFLTLTASIGLRSVAEDGTRLDGPNTLILAAWALLLVYFIVEHLIRAKVYGTLLVPAAALSLTISALLKAMGRSAVELSPLIQDWKIGIHVFLIMFANAGFIVCGVAAALYLVQEAQLKAARTNVLFKRLPPLANIDLLSRRAAALSFPGYTAGLLLGVIRAIETDPPGWWQDPRVMLAGLVWAVFGSYLVLHYTQRVSARATARFAVAGVVLVVALSVIARTVPAGFHVFGV